MESEKAKRKRPVLVWVIFIYYMFSLAFTLLSFYLTHAGVVPMPPEQKAYIEGLTTLDYAVTAILMLVTFTGAIALFLLKRAALYLFLANLSLNIITVVWHAVSKGWLAAVGGPGLIGMLIGWGIIAAVCYYAWRLTRSGVLT